MGQTNGAVRFLARTPRYAIEINRDGTAQYRPAGAVGEARLEWVDGRSEPESVAEHRLPATRNYYFGDDPA
jgi:hypothetical protein